MRQEEAWPRRLLNRHVSHVAFIRCKLRRFPFILQTAFRRPNDLSIPFCLVAIKEETATRFPLNDLLKKREKNPKRRRNTSSCVTVHSKRLHVGQFLRRLHIVVLVSFFCEPKMKTKFINGVSSSPTLSLGLLVTENVLQVQPSTEEHCKELIRPDEPDSDTRRKAYLWCREFLHGSWKSLHESDFKITIIRYDFVQLK